MINFVRKLSLSKQLAISLTIVAILPLISFSYQSFFISRKAVIDLQQNALNSQLDSKEKQIRNWFSERLMDLRTLGRSTCLKDCSCIDGKHDSPLFSALSSTRTIYMCLFLYDKNWKQIQEESTFSHNNTDVVSDSLKSLLSKSKGLVVTSDHIHGDGSVNVDVSCQLRDGNSIVGYAVAVLDATNAVSSVVASKESGFRVRLLNEAGDDILAPGISPVDSIPSQVLSGCEKLCFWESLEGSAVAGVSRKLGGTGWTLIIEASEERTMRWLDTLLNRGILSVVVIVLVVLFLIGWLSRSITMPIRLLSTVAEQVSKGNTDVRMVEDGSPESIALALAFNRMLAKLAMANIELNQKKSLAAIGEFTSSLVHEMRNPLSSVRINLQGFATKLGDDEIYKELATISVEQVDKIERMLNELLQYGKPTELQREVVSLEDLLAGIRDDGEMITESGDRLLISSCDNSDCQRNLFIDEPKIRQVFVNLIDNACKAGEEGCEVVVSFRWEDNDLIFTVSDNGPGIPPNIIDEVFLPFISAREGGTGLGLANVKRFVELHGGTVKAINRDGNGAEITIVLTSAGVS